MVIAKNSYFSSSKIGKTQHQKSGTSQLKYDLENWFYFHEYTRSNFIFLFLS